MSESYRSAPVKRGDVATPPVRTPSGMLTMPKLTAQPPDGGDTRGFVETKPSGPAEDIFLAPHVIDRTAFADYAQQLRSLIAEAEEKAQGLRGAMLEARSLDDQISSRAAEQSRQLAAAVKVLKAFDAVRRSAPPTPHGEEPRETALDIQQADQLTSRAQRQIRVSVESALAELDRRAGAVVSSIQERQARLEARLDALARKEQAIADLLEQIERTTERVQEQGRSLVALHCRATDAIDRLESMIQSESGDDASSEDSSADSSEPSP